MPNVLPFDRDPHPRLTVFPQRSTPPMTALIKSLFRLAKENPSGFAALAEIITAALAPETAAQRPRTSRATTRHR